jgi:hypothetical protein
VTVEQEGFALEGIALEDIVLGDTALEDSVPGDNALEDIALEDMASQAGEAWTAVAVEATAALKLAFAARWSSAEPSEPSSAPLTVWALQTALHYYD